MSTTFGMFVKFPQPGRVKTRLVAAIGDANASRLYEAFVTDLCSQFGAIADRRVLAFSPISLEARQYFGELSSGRFELWPQPDESLGDRMQSFFETFGPDPVVLIGSDSPTLPREFVDDALRQLDLNDVVLGPATDGGLYLIGLNGHRTSGSLQRTWPIFQGIDWSTSRVLEQVCERLAKAEASVHLLPPWYDVDQPDDLNLLQGHLLGLQLSSKPAIQHLPATRAVLADIK